MEGKRSDRVADLVRKEISEMLVRTIKDPRIGFVTITRVQVSPDLQQARVFYTVLGTSGSGVGSDDKARRSSAKALERAAPFLRRQIGARLRLRRVPELRFLYDESIAGQDRIEQLLNELHANAPSDHGDNDSES
jgi:ribosome-binding factor A